MGYYAQIMIEAKERYGHILKDRGLVMRGETVFGKLKLVFKSEDGVWRLPVEITVPDKGATGKLRAEWDDVKVMAVIHSNVKIGDSGWIGFVERHSETLERSDCKNISEFVSAIGTYVRDCVVVPNVVLENEVSSEVAAAYFELTDRQGVKSEDIEFKVDADVQTLITYDGAGQAISFVWSENTRTGEVLVDGRCVEQIDAFEYADIENAISENFERRVRRRSR